MLSITYFARKLIDKKEPIPYSYFAR